jgi:hypothetical protein
MVVMAQDGVILKQLYNLEQYDVIGSCGNVSDASDT